MKHALEIWRDEMIDVATRDGERKGKREGEREKERSVVLNATYIKTEALVAETLAYVTVVNTHPSAIDVAVTALRSRPPSRAIVVLVETAGVISAAAVYRRCGDGHH